jgi:hypothetical protein
LVLLASLSAGCVTFYEPLLSLQKPVVVDPTVANFANVHILIRCVPGDYVGQQEADTVCRNLRTLFQNQGAQVSTEVPNPRGPARYATAGPPPDLVMELQSRMLHREDNAPLWALATLTCTIIPGVTDDTFATDVTVRDSSGALLISETLEGRFQRYVGVLVWGTNEVADLLVRSDAERVTGDAAPRDFSRDFYGQLSQIAFNANMRALVMHGYATDGPSASPPAPTNPPTRAPAVGPAAPPTAQPPPSSPPNASGGGKP